MLRAGRRAFWDKLHLDCDIVKIMVLYSGVNLPFWRIFL
jgi:hypothetical protein